MQLSTFYLKTLTLSLVSSTIQINMMHSCDYRVTEGNEQGYAGIMGHLIIPLPYLDVRLNR